jgi:hypothetical protein
MQLCIKCKGRGWCGGPCKILAQLRQFQPKIKKEFSGSSPPEVFVGKYGYPNVFAGILSPNEYGNTEKFSMPELWHQEQSSITDILGFRSRMIYSRFTLGIKSAKSKQKTKFLNTLQEISLATKAADMSFKLKKQPSTSINLSKYFAMIGNPAPLQKVKIESNIKVEKKVDYLVNDTDVKSVQALKELYHARIPISHMIKILSAGMLGLKIQRKLVPTRWAVTATDDTLGKFLVEKIRGFPQISEYRLFNANYLGNYYQILLVPNCWSFEVIEASSKGYFGQGQGQNQGQSQDQRNIAMWQDYELFYGRKKYANSVTGAYYSNRLAICEYLIKIRKQATAIVFREVREEYWAPCGVGILREVTREAMNKKPKTFDNLNDALNEIKKQFKLPVNIFIRKSKLIKELKTQKRLSSFSL